MLDKFSGARSVSGTNRWLITRSKAGIYNCNLWWIVIITGGREVVLQTSIRFKNILWLQNVYRTLRWYFCRL